MTGLLIVLSVFFVQFTDKPQKDVPALSPRAVEQRAKWHIATDELDYPVASVYVDSLRRAGARVYHSSRWMNGATCEMTEATAQKVAQWSFVKAVEMTRDNSPYIYGAPKRRIPESQPSTADSQQSTAETDAQLALYNLTPLHEKGFEGQGILMAVCDGGFTNAHTMSCFRQELELGHFDFTDDQDDFYSWRGVHGTECLSTISGLQDDFRGAATKAQYYLMRSEEYSPESPKEMDNLTVALEKADSLGVNVFSVSLGYAYFDNDSWTLPKSALDGRTTRASRAATIAARKGMLVCVAAGNEGNDAWQTISAPADADSVLTVGAVDTQGYIGSFSSYGPSADGRIKPEVCAVGVQTTLIYPNGSVTRSNGTSFATPLLAGMAASLWSALPNENAMQIRERIIRSADRYDNPDTKQYGYGIPDAWKAYTMNIRETDANCQLPTEGSQSCTKILRDGQIRILRGGHAYSTLGERLY